jgi:hypothetical protein
VDPDRDPAEFIAIQQKFGIAAGKTEDGRVITDASVVVVSGERRHFITTGDLIQVNEGQEEKARSLVEQTLTAGIQVVVSGDAPRLCFTHGWGEPSVDEGGMEGLLALHARLDKLNYQIEELPSLGDLEGPDTIADCKLVVVAGPSQPLPKAEVERLKRFVENGGNALVFAGPELASSGRGFVDQGLGPLLAVGGLARRQDLVFERDDARKWTQGQGETMLALPKPHPITRAFIESDGALPIVLAVTSSLAILPNAATAPAALLMTSDEAFGMRGFVEWAEDPVTPEPQPNDNPGPLVLAYAVELPRVRDTDERGPRMVVFGTKSAVVGANWTNERLQGTARLVESAISWLAAKTVIVDVPSKPERSLGAGMTQDDVSSAAWKLVLLLPLSTALFGVAVALRRRATSKGSAKPKDNASSADDSQDEDDPEDPSEDDER